LATHHTACILCSRNCGLLVETDEHQFQKISGDKSCPTSQGYICQKAARLTHYQTHDDRLQNPLKRRQDGTFERISWEQALSEIAQHLNQIKSRHGGEAFAFYGGGGQGNHLGGAYGRQLLKAMDSYYLYNALGQEKTGDFWVNGRLFGKQNCHTTEDVEHTDFVLFIGTNPYQSHGIPNARDTLKHIRNDPQRTMVVVDPRLTDTAKMADIHLAIRPGTDAYLMAAMLGIIVQEGLHDRAFLDRHCTGFQAVEETLGKIPVDDFISHTELDADQVYKVARAFALARSACVRVDLGIQQTLHSTLNSYLEKLLFLISGNFGIAGGNNLHSVLVPFIGHTEEKNPNLIRSARYGMVPIAGIFPPNILPGEIDNDRDDRIRVLFVDSGNPALTIADSQAMDKAMRKLELLVVVDVAMTETARHAHYILPAASQFEKFEATGFNLEFPTNYFHLRHPIFSPLGETLTEAEIYTRLLEAMGVMPRRFPGLTWVAGAEPKLTRHVLYFAMLALKLGRHRDLAHCAPSILYRTLGKHYGRAASAITLLPLAMTYAAKNRIAVRRTGAKGNRFTLGMSLFERILNSPQGTAISEHRHEDVLKLILATEDRKVHLAVPELLKALSALEPPAEPDPEFPLVLMAGERRAYNANQIYRDPGWRKQDADGALRIHPEDASEYRLVDGARALCTTHNGQLEVVVKFDATTRKGFATLPHGYGMRYRGAAPNGPHLNLLTSSEHCDPMTYTPYHKYVPMSIRPCAVSVRAG